MNVRGPTIDTRSASQAVLPFADCVTEAMCRKLNSTISEGQNYRS